MGDEDPDSSEASEETGEQEGIRVQVPSPVLQAL